MTPERYKALMNNDSLKLTLDERKEHWHFCYDWDGLLIGPGMMEMECCYCYADDKQENAA